jgi:hypothetical protein
VFFEHAPFPTVGCSGGSRRASPAARAGSNSTSPDVRFSLLVGKNAGNFGDSAVSCENPSRKHLQIQAPAIEFPTDRAGNLFSRAGNLFGFSTGAGNLARNRSAPADATIAVKCISIIDNK